MPLEDIETILFLMLENRSFIMRSAISARLRRTRLWRSRACGTIRPGWMPAPMGAAECAMRHIRSLPDSSSNGGTLEHAQSMAGHESPRTTKLYDRTKDRLTQDEVERIRL